MKPATLPDIDALLIAAINDCMQWQESDHKVLVETKAGIRPPAGLYATLWWKRIEYLKQYLSDHELTDEDAATWEYIKNEALCTVQVTFRGPTALNSAHAFRQYIEAGNRLFDLWQLIGFSHASAVIDLSAYYNGAVQQRACFDLEFYAAFTRRYAADYFVTQPFTVNN